MDDHSQFFQQQFSVADSVYSGRGLRKVLGGSLNGSIQSGAGIGRDRPYDFMISGGLSLAGIHRRG